MHRLHIKCVRLFTLGEAYQVRKEQELSPSSAIEEPYYLYESHLVNYENRLNVIYYIKNLFLVNKDKGMFVLPYFPG
jgi:23S rRNA-/tRNA-specific pseudouridylate synthase